MGQTTPHDTDNYERIAKAIGFIHERRLKQPELAEVANVVGLSPQHFQRLFTNWVGVSPKRFMGYLTGGHARQLLTAGGDILDASLEVGLSGPGRLHDLCVNLEAATPGEIKSGGKGLIIKTGYHPSPFGSVLIHSTERGICGISFATAKTRAKEEARMKNRWPNASFVEDGKATAPLVKKVFALETYDNANPFRVFIGGTNFQVQVWQALITLSPGQLTTYGRIAKAIGRPNAQRAVGSAVGKNPISFLIPCHRVIREGGIIDGYYWGTERKAAMIGWEQAKTEA